MTNTLYSRGNPYTVKRVTSPQQVGEGEFIISDGTEITLPQPTQDGTVVVRGPAAQTTKVVPPGSTTVQLQSKGIRLESGENAVFVSNGDNWYVRNQVDFFGFDIPDAGDLYIRTVAPNLSASNGQSISSIPDETGNNSDLTGDGVYRVDAINNNDALEYTSGDPTEDGHQVSLASTVSPPYLVSFVANWTDVLGGSGATGLFGISSNDPNGAIADEESGGTGQFVLFDGNGNEGRTSITPGTAYIWTLEAPNSDEFTLYINGASEIQFSNSGAAPTFDILAQGSRWNQDATNAQIPEVFGYDYSSASDISRSEIESHLDDEYGPIL